MADFNWATERSRLLDTRLTVFGRDVTYTEPAGIDSYDVPAVLDFSDIARAKERGIAGTCSIRLSDFVAAPVRNGTIEADGVIYRIANDPQNERDGAGGATLFLRKQ